MWGTVRFLTQIVVACAGSIGVWAAYQMRYTANLG
jgi:hypothetical protein